MGARTVCLLLTEAQIVAKVRAGSGQVGAGRGGQGSAFKRPGLGTTERPAPMETAMDYAGALIRRVQPAPPCLPGTPFVSISSAPQVLLRPESLSLRAFS